MATQRKQPDDIEALMPNTESQPEDEMKESKIQCQNRNKRMGISCWGRIFCYKVVAFFADLLNLLCLSGSGKRLLARIFGLIYEAFRDIEGQQELPPYVDPHF